MNLFNMPAYIRSCISLSQFLTRLKSHHFHYLFPSFSVIASHIVHIHVPCFCLSLHFPFYFYLVCLRFYLCLTLGAPELRW